MKSYDVLIINQGISGLVLACGLSKYFRIVVIENESSFLNTCETDQWDINVSLINMASMKILQHIKIWNKYLLHFSSLLHKLEIFINDSMKKIVLNSGYLGYPELGYIIDNKVIYYTLYNYARQLKNIIFMSSNLLDTINYHQDAAFIKLNNNSIFKTKLVIGADGISSWVRKNADISIIFRDTKYYGLTNIIYTPNDHENILRCIIYHGGFLILLPLRNMHFYSVFWLLSSRVANKYLYISTANQSINDDLIKICNLSLGNCRYVVCDNKKNKISMLRMQYTPNFVGHRLILLGKAAYTTCPLFFQNINLELADVAILLNYLIQLQYNNKDIGLYSCLEDYKYNRKYKIIKDIMNTSYFNILFYDQSDMVRYIRHFLFYFINTIPNVKTYMLHHIMGLDDIPEWLL